MMGIRNAAGRVACRFPSLTAAGARAQAAGHRDEACRRPRVPNKYFAEISMRSRTRTLAPLCAAFVLTLLPPLPASAQSGLIKFIVGVAAGGAVDPYARIIGDQAV